MLVQHLFALHTMLCAFRCFWTQRFVVWFCARLRVFYWMTLFMDTEGRFVDVFTRDRGVTDGSSRILL